MNNIRCFNKLSQNLWHKITSNKSIQTYPNMTDLRIKHCSSFNYNVVKVVFYITL